MRRATRKPKPAELLEAVLKLCRAALETETGGCCIEWPGAPSGNGYGGIWIEGKKDYVHRVVYRLLVGDIKPKMHIDHTCRNRLCCNPRHLEQVTSKVNTLRGDSPPAQNARKEKCNQGHPLVGPVGNRRCETCAGEAVAERKERTKFAADMVAKIWDLAERAKKKTA